MAAITFLVRYVFFTTIIDIKLSERVKTVLFFTAPCILTAMLVPIMFHDVIEAKELASVFSSSYFLAGFCAIVFSLLIRHTLLVILLSMFVFYVLRIFM